MMDDGKRKRENKKRGFDREKLSISRLSDEIICPACGTGAEREFARFCRVCGKILFEDYEPLDALRASYRMQGKSLRIDSKPAPNSINLFEENKNSASSTAWAFLVYSLVPYLGILFCPGAILMGCIGIYVSYRKPYLGGWRTSVYSIVLSFAVLGIQIFLWWLLYIIPELGRSI
jgi:hypothetical protein